DLHGGPGPGVGEQVTDSVVAGTGEQPQLPITALASRERWDVLHPRVVGPQQETQHRIRVGAGKPLGLGHGTAVHKLGVFAALRELLYLTQSRKGAKEITRGGCSPRGRRRP